HASQLLNPLLNGRPVGLRAECDDEQHPRLEAVESFARDDAQRTRGLVDLDAPAARPRREHHGDAASPRRFHGVHHRRRNVPAPAWISSLSVTVTPTPRTDGEDAMRNALRRLRGPSESASRGGRWAAAKTTGRSSLTTRSTRNAVSSSVSVPWDTTMPASAAS